MARISKNRKAVIAKFNLEKEYSLTDAAKMLKDITFTKFDASVDVDIRLGIDPKKLNPNGGAIAVGHPLGSSGARLSVQLFNEMRRQNKKYGLVTACVGGGQGVAGVYEFLN